jgi:hypothetical protein
LDEDYDVGVMWKGEREERKKREDKILLLGDGRVSIKIPARPEGAQRL